MKLPVTTLSGIALLAAVLPAAPAEAQVAVDKDVSLIVGATIHTMNPSQPTADAMAVKDGILIAVGAERDVREAAGSDYEYYDLSGTTIVPGFIESHDHMVMWSGTLDMLDVTPFTTPTLEAALARLAAAEPDEDGWVVAWAADPTLYREKRGPTIQELDALYPATPVLVWHMSGHGAYVNSRALELAGITKESVAPPGGEFEKDGAGNFTGYLKGRPAALAVGKMPDVNAATTMKAARIHASRGFTTATEFAILDPGLLMMIEDATRDPDFPVRLYGGLFVTMPGLEEAARQIGNYETDLFKVPFIKAWTDGSIQGGTGYLKEGYHKLDSDSSKGATGTQEDINAWVLTMYELGFRPGIHANGDAAMDLALNALEYARKKTGRTDIRPHLIHGQVIRPEQFPRIKALGAGITMFTPHVYFWGDMHRDVLLGEERAARVDPMRTAIEHGIPTAIHNDPPVSPPDALHSMWVAVNRRTSSGKVLGPEERISAEQALAAYTREAAVVLGIEDEVGTLEQGKKADFVVLAENPLEVDPERIKDIDVLITVMGGRVTHMSTGIYVDQLHRDK
jgi:predicted amidohydrolase YtcJ